MSAPVDDFDLDIRIGAASRLLDPAMAARTSDFETCNDSHCATCGSACNTEHPPRCTRYCTV
ncbi:hypothetical protein [Nocardia sp. CS682]|uniref:hypothetical protein n=1 Tax=Nocardia sp. CS682 TaxID=1047172 RepID=UPI0010756F9A|nr:hypothetical protein [Nocardia sp. CS682]QBS39033.1 hypothetical protein DMB37_01810 [Nocardia sp. CS682]